MPRKTSINNLNIVWQGQSWSVIAPNGVVIGRFKEKFEAEQYAQNTKDYISKDYEEFAEEDFYYPSKRKRGYVDLEKDEIDEIPSRPISNHTVSSKFELKQLPSRTIGYVVVISIILGVVYVVVRPLVASLAELLSPTFFGPAAIPLLLVLSIVVPIGLFFANGTLPQLLKVIFGWPLILLGILGFMIFLVLGVVLLIYSLFSSDVEFFRTFITFGLLVFICFALALGGAVMAGQADI